MNIEPKLRARFRRSVGDHRLARLRDAQEIGVDRSAISDTASPLGSFLRLRNNMTRRLSRGSLRNQRASPRTAMQRERCKRYKRYLAVFYLDVREHAFAMERDEAC